MSGQYVLEDPSGGFWYYLTSAPVGAEVRLDAPDGPPLLASSRGFWFWSAERAEVLWAVGRPYTRTVGWKLKEGVSPIEGRPAKLTASNEWDDEQLAALYDRVTEHLAPPPIEVEVPALELVGTPVESITPMKWVASLPYELANHPEFAHLFPGQLQGVREALASELNLEHGVKAYTLSGWGVYVSKGKKTTEIKASMPYSIPASSRAEALERYADLRHAWLERVSAVKVCPHCDGTGWAP